MSISINKKHIGDPMGGMWPNGSIAEHILDHMVYVYEEYPEPEEYFQGEEFE